MWTSKVLSGINRIALEINFYDNETHQGDSVLPFVGFMVVLAALIVVLVGATKYFTAKHEFYLFYDERDKKNLDDKKYVKSKQTGKIMMIVGAVIILAYFIIGPLVGV